MRYETDVVVDVVGYRRWLSYSPSYVIRASRHADLPRMCTPRSVQNKSRSNHHPLRLTMWGHRLDG